MSQTGKRKYAKGLKTKYRILKLLAKSTEYPQYDMPKKIGKEYRQVIRILHELRDHNLIYLKRTEQSLKGGKPKNIWSITFYGLIEVLKFCTNQTINHIARTYSDEWLIFSELNFLLNKLGEYEDIFYINLRRLSGQFNSLLTDLVQNLNENEIKQMGHTLEKWEKRNKQIDETILEETKRICTNSILGLRYFNDPVSYFSGFIFKSEDFRHEFFTGEKRDLTGLSENVAIRHHITNQFQRAEIAFSYLKMLETSKG